MKEHAKKFECDQRKVWTIHLFHSSQLLKPPVCYLTFGAVDYVPVVHVGCWYLVQTLLRLLQLWDLLSSQGCTFRFFCIQLTFIISSNWCTTIILFSILTEIFFPDLVLFKFRHVSSFRYFKIFFEWLLYLVADAGEMQT